MTTMQKLIQIVEDAESLARFIELVPQDGGFIVKWVSPASGRGPALTFNYWRYVTLDHEPPTGAAVPADGSAPLVFMNKETAVAAARRIIDLRSDEFALEPNLDAPTASGEPKTIKPSGSRKESLPVYYHVTEREDAIDIVAHGFLGGWGDVGFGVYFYGSIEDARKYARKGGWDGRLKEPVILAVQDESIERVSEDDLHPSWGKDLYANMYWRPMDEDAEDEHWMPRSVNIVEIVRRKQAAK